MTELPPLIAGVLLAQLSPGPNMMAVAAHAFGSGRPAALATAAGVASGVFVWAVLFKVGAAALLAAYPQALIAMKLLGGGYLCWLALKAAIGAVRSRRAGGAPEARVASRGAAYRTGVLVVLTNPKAALMWVAIAAFMAASPSLSGQFLLVGIGAAASAMVVYGGYALLFSTGVATRAYARGFRVIDAGFAAAFGALGGRLVLDGVRELRS